VVEHGCLLKGLGEFLINFTFEYYSEQEINLILAAPLEAPFFASFSGVGGLLGMGGTKVMCLATSIV
jgi:hypothetical protein